MTPSQSASQVIDHDRSHVPLGQRYTSHFEDVEEQEGVPSDTDSEEDYRRAFVEPRSRLPAPHELGVAADTHDSFIPNAAADGSAPPPPPRKEDVAGRVPMPAVPSAPRLSLNQARGQSQDTSADQGFTPGSPSSPPRYSMSRRSGDSEGGYGHQRKSSNSLIGKVSRLFKTDMRNGASGEDERGGGGGGGSSSGWNTRTNANVEQESERRRFASLRRAGPDSSDEEDTREVFRNVNQARPGWDAKGGSDVGGKKLTSRILPGPKSNRATEAEQAEIDRIRASVVGGGIGAVAPTKLASGADSIRSNTTLTKKKKKKRATAGSEIGTAPTRPSASYTVSGDLSSLHHNTNPTDANARPGLSRSSTLKSTSSKKKNRTSIASTGLVGGNIFNPNAGKYGADSWIKKSGSQMTAYEAVAMAGVVPKSAAPKDKPAAPAPPASNTPASLAPLPPAPAAASSSRPASITSSASQKPPLKSALKPATLSRSNSTASAKAAPSSPTKKAAAPLSSGASVTPGTPIKSALRNDITQSIRAEPIPQPKMEPIPKAPAPVTSTPLPESVAPTQPAAAPPAASPQAAATAAAQKPASEEPAATQVPAVEPAEAANSTAPAAPLSVLSIEEDKGFDGTGRLDVPVDAGTAQGVEKEEAAVIAPQPKAPMPKLEMPSSEPFSVSFDGARRGSAVTTGSAADDAVVTPGAEQTYKAFLQQHGQSPSVERSANATPLGTVVEHVGVERLTDRKVKIEPSRVYGAGAPEVSDTSSEEGSPVKPSHHAEQGAQRAAQVQASSALVDPAHKPDAGLQGLSGPPAAVATPALAAASLSPAKAISHSSLAMAKAPSDSGSAISRRKSVRMAPDVKLPPDTPTDAETPRGTEHGSKDPIAARGAQLSSRIAPPPAAPAKATKEAGPIDLAGGRQNTGWTSRVRDTADSSDEEDVDDDGYSSARKAFGSATRGWGEATGTVKPKAKKTAGDTASVRSGTKKSAAGKATAPSSAAATVAPAAPQPSIGYVPTAPGSISSTMYTAKAPGSSVGVNASGVAPSTSMYSVTAPGSSIGANAGAVAPSTSMYSVNAPTSVLVGVVLPPPASTTTGAAPVPSTPAAAPATTAPTTAATATAPAPLTASNLNALDNKPTMPPVPVAPPVPGQSTISVPTAPPPAVSGKAGSSVSKGGFFRRFKRNK